MDLALPVPCLRRIQHYERDWRYGRPSHSRPSDGRVNAFLSFSQATTRSERSDLGAVAACQRKLSAVTLAQLLVSQLHNGRFCV